MTSRADTFPSKALEALQTWLSDGSLATAVNQHKLGSELDEVRAVLRSGKADLERVELLAQVADLGGDVPWDSVQDYVKQLATAGRALKDARTPDELFDWRRAQWQLVKAAANGLERALKDAWRVRCEAPFRDHERLGEVLGRVPETKALGSEMVNTARQGKA